MTVGEKDLGRLKDSVMAVSQMTKSDNHVALRDVGKRIGRLDGED